MSSVVIAGNTSGTITLDAPNVAGTTVLTLPTANGTVLTTGSTGQVINKASLPTGSVLQVVSVIKTNSFTTTSTSLVDITGLSVSITPTSVSSQILILVNVRGTSSDATANAGDAGIVLVRNSTNIAVSTGGSSYNWMGQTSGRNIGSTAVQASASVSFLDSPATTSSITYKIQASTAGGTLFINRDQDGGNGSVSSITLMEIAA
jgi:hypothetical protein